MIIGERESPSVPSGRRRALGSATALDVASGGSSTAAGAGTPTSRGLGQQQFSNPLQSPGGAVHNTRTEYGSAYFRDGMSSPKEHVLTKSAAERVRRMSENANSPTGSSHKSPSSPFPVFGAVVHGKAHTPVSSAMGHGRGSSRGLGDRHSDSPRSPAAAAAGPMFGIPPARAPTGAAAAPFALGSSQPDMAAALRVVGGGRTASAFDSRGVAAVMSSSLPQTSPMHTPSSGRSRTPNAVRPEQECNLGEVTLGYGSASLQGMRDYQEDALGFLHAGDSLSGGVFDGHGGDHVSRELERCLLQNITRGIAELAAKDQGVIGPSPANVQAAIFKAYTQTNQDIGNRVSMASEAGSCAVTFTLTRAAGVLHLFVANAGDCRAVLYTGSNGVRKPVRLSEDHKPLPQVCPAEIARVSAAGGCVLWGRVQGCLAVSRAFGDRALHPYVIADPYVCVRPLNLDQDTFFYLASDGVTDMVDDATGCQVVAEALAKGQSAVQAAQALVNTAYHKGSSDNISAIVVRLRKR